MIGRGAEETQVLLPKNGQGSCEIGLGDNDLLSVAGGFDWNRITSARLSDGLWIYGRRAVLADDLIAALVKAHWAAYLACIEHSHYIAIRLLEQEEANLFAVKVHGVAMQVAIGNVTYRNLKLAIGDHEFMGRREGSGALGVDELRRDQNDKNER